MGIFQSARADSIVLRGGLGGADDIFNALGCLALFQTFQRSPAFRADPLGFRYPFSDGRMFFENTFTECADRSDARSEKKKKKKKKKYSAFIPPLKKKKKKKK